jgi:hypothetical protein
VRLLGTAGPRRAVLGEPFGCSASQTARRLVTVVDLPVPAVTPIDYVNFVIGSHVK